MSLNRSVNATVNDIRDLICNGDLLDRAFVFPNETLRDNIKSQLCNLTIAQFTELYDIFTSKVNTTRTTQEVVLKYQ